MTWPSIVCVFISSNSVVGELGRLVEDLLRDRDLADVVEQGRELELLAARRVDAQLVGHRVDELDDRAAVVGRVVVLELDDVGEQHDRAAVGALQLERRRVALPPVAREDSSSQTSGPTRAGRPGPRRPRQRDRRRRGARGWHRRATRPRVLDGQLARGGRRRARSRSTVQRSRQRSARRRRARRPRPLERGGPRARGPRAPAPGRCANQESPERAEQRAASASVPRMKSGSIGERLQPAATSSGTSGSGARSEHRNEEQLLGDHVAVPELEANARDERVADDQRDDQERVRVRAPMARQPPEAPRRRGRRPRKRRRRPRSRVAHPRARRSRASPTSCSAEH